LAIFKRRNTKQMEEGDDIENMVTGKELRQRYVGSGNEQKMPSLSNQGNDKGKKGKSGSNSKEILTAASIAIVAVLIITLLLVFAIHFFQSSD
jgi:hypothetical protein